MISPTMSPISPEIGAQFSKPYGPGTAGMLGARCTAVRCGSLGEGERVMCRQGLPKEGVEGKRSPAKGTCHEHVMNMLGSTVNDVL